jgi:RNA polymerase sigma factor (TIGR02999 family)
LSSNEVRSPMQSDDLNTYILHPLVERIQQGDLAASNELLSRCAERLQSLARKMLRRFFPHGRPIDDTNDVMQNATLRLLNTLQAIRPNDTRHFFNLAALQIRQVLLDLLRSCKSRNRFQHISLSPGDPDQPAAELASAVGDDADLDLWEAFHEAIDQLDPDEREVVALRFYHGWTQPQIAELLGVTERTVRRSWKRACLTLTERLQGNLPEL